MSVSDLRKELREMRKQAIKPVSRMTKADCAMELERLKHHSATTPAVAQHSPSDKRPETSTASTLKKMQEHPLLTPAQERMKKARDAKKSTAPASGDAGEKKKSSKKDLLAKMARMLESDEE
jgi:hypothetical protein